MAMVSILKLLRALLISPCIKEFHDLNNTNDGVLVFFQSVYFQGSMIRETHFNHTFIMSAYESNQSHVAAYNMSHTYSSTYSEHKRSAIYHFYQTGFNVKLYPEDVATIQALYSSESSPSKSQELHAILKTGKGMK